MTIPSRPTSFCARDSETGWTDTEAKVKTACSRRGQRFFAKPFTPTDKATTT